MRLLAHVWQLLADTTRFSISTRNTTLLLVVVLSLLAVVTALFLQVAAPAALYPFL